MEQKVLRAGTAAVAFALVLRVLSMVNVVGILQKVITPEAAAWIMLMHTGRVIRPSDLAFTPTDPTTETEAAPTEPTQLAVPVTPAQPTEPTEPVPTLPAFSADQAEEIRINCGFSYSADLAALLTKPLGWDLTGEEPTVAKI